MHQACVTVLKVTKQQKKKIVLSPFWRHNLLGEHIVQGAPLDCWLESTHKDEAIDKARQGKAQRV